VDGIHDMGGMHGFGPIVREENEPVFHHAWEGRVYAMSMWRQVPIDGGFRYAIERMNPAHYLATSYYEKWLYIITQAYIAAGVFTQAELDDRVAQFRSNPRATLPQRTNPERAQRVLADTFAPESLRKTMELQPVFRIGDTVRARNIHPVGHTRLPRYARGKRGIVTQYYGIQDIDDTLPTGAKAQPLYSVRFDAEELWGESAEPNCALYIDMWESYLEPS
jgi:nitrile hydratase beta subunit